MGRGISGRKPPEEAKRALEAQLSALRVQGLFRRRRVGSSWKGKHYIVVYAGSPICRMAYTGLEGSEWECAIYRPLMDAFGTDGLVFPTRGDPLESASMALVAFGHNCVS